MGANETAAQSVTIRHTYRASPEKVFRAWTQAEALKRWMGPGDAGAPRAEVDLRIGGRFRIHILSTTGKENIAVGVYKEIDPPRRLVFTWSWETDEKPFESVVTLQFKEAAEHGTDLVLTHERFPDAKTRDAHESGWSGCLLKLAKEVE